MSFVLHLFDSNLLPSVSLSRLDYVKLDEDELSFLQIISRLEVHMKRSFVFCFVFVVCVI